LFADNFTARIINKENTKDDQRPSLSLMINKGSIFTGLLKITLESEKNE